MHQIELLNLDLNLLIALQALLDEQSVTGAARRLGRTQSATSHALARLRLTFDDPLLVRQGNEMMPTPRARRLHAPLEAILSEVVQLVREEPSFEPASSTRSFRLAAPDLFASLVPGLIAELSERAPRVALELTPPLRGSGFEHLADGSVDLAVEQSPPAGGGLVVAGLGHIEFVVVGRQGHPFFCQPNAESWVRWAHVIVSSGDASLGFVGQLARAAGIERRVGLRVPTFLLAVHVVAQTELLFAAPRALVLGLADQLGLEFAALPIVHRPIPVAAIWHERFAAEPGQRWFRRLVIEFVRKAWPSERPDASP